MKRLLILFLIAAPAFAKSMHWERIAVRAELDYAGTLHVREEQTLVFYGNWNGGERAFRVEPGQTFTFRGISRVGGSGNVVPLQYGFLNAVDEYQLVDEHTVRWRSRMESDPPFLYDRITYVLEYTLGGVLLRGFRGYTLNHDFAFPDRPGVIETLTVDLDLAAAWETENMKPHFEFRSLQPGQGAVIRGTLRYVGNGAPEAAVDAALVRRILAAVLLFGPILFALLLLLHERRVGRIGALPPVDRKTIEETLLPVPAEVVGALWDEEVGEAEVAALLARWSAEGKITATSTSPSELELVLNVSREAFTGYERLLIDKLFYSGEQTSTSAIRSHYYPEGFQPKHAIADGLRARADAVLQAEARSLQPALLLLLPAALLVWYLPRPTGDKIPTFVIAGVMLLAGAMGFMYASIWRRRIDSGVAAMKSFAIPACVAVAMALATLAIDHFSLPARLALSTLALTVAGAIFLTARSRGGARAIALRRRLASIRQYFIDELHKKRPDIDDAWFPYVVAFGLQENAVQWTYDFGPPPTRESSASEREVESSRSPSFTDAGEHRWTGGGGAFGGAGATGSWASAASGIAAGVAAAPSVSTSGGDSGFSSSDSSSSSSSGWSSSSDSSSSSSGGGSGGGW